MDCRHASQLISQSQDASLSWRQRIGLRFHLMLCDACTQFSRQLALLRQAVRQARRHVEHDTGLHLSREARQRIAEAMAAQRRMLDEARRNPDQHQTD